jgi:hypothetical protein
MKSKTRPVQALPVDFEINDHDCECALLGKAGWHTAAIARATNLSPSQVQYRLGLAGVKRRDYRDGNSEMSHFMLAQMRARSNAKKRMASANWFSNEIDVMQKQFVEHLDKKRHPELIEK